MESALEVDTALPETLKKPLTNDQAPTRSSIVAAPGLKSTASRKSAAVFGSKKLPVSKFSTRRRESLLEMAANPFETRVPWTGYEIFKVILLGPTLFILRLAVLIVCIIFGLLWACIMTIGTRYKWDHGLGIPTEDWGDTRRAFLYPIMWVVRLMLWCVGFWWINTKDHRPSDGITKLPGKQLAGEDLLVEKMTVQQAKLHLRKTKVPGAKGFCYVGKDTGLPLEIHFRATLQVRQGSPEDGQEWTSYRLLPKTRIICVAPHASNLDPFVAGILFPPLPSAIGTIDLVRGPGLIISPWFKCAQAIFVDRFKPESCSSAKAELERRAHPDCAGPPTVVFPEGTTTNGSVLIQFKAGAFSPGQPVQPVAIRYPYSYLPITFTGDLKGPFLILRMMCQFYNSCEVEILDPYVPSEAEQQDSELYADNVRLYIADHLGMGVSNHSVADSALANQGLLWGAGNQLQNDFVIKEAIDKYGFTKELITTFLKIFSQIDKGGDGYIQREELQESIYGLDTIDVPGFEVLSLIKVHLKEDGEELLDQIFDLIDTDRTGKITYREFLQLSAMLWKDTTQFMEGRAKLMFLLCSPDPKTLLIPKTKLLSSFEFEEYIKLPDQVCSEEVIALHRKYPQSFVPATVLELIGKEVTLKSA